MAPHRLYVLVCSCCHCVCVLFGAFCDVGQSVPISFERCLLTVRTGFTLFVFCCQLGICVLCLFHVVR